MIKANFNAYASYVTDSLHQWDINQVLSVSGLNLAVVPEVHFSNANTDRAIVRQATKVKNVVSVPIPNSLLQDPLTIYAHIGIYESNTFKVVEKIEIPVIARKRPSDYRFENADEEVYSFAALENAIANMITKAEASVISARIDTIIANANETNGNSELVDMRVDVDGTTHNSAGKAIRTQISELKTGFSNLLRLIEAGSISGYYNEVSSLDPNKMYALGVVVSTTGTYTIQSGTERSAAHMVDTVCDGASFTANAEKIIYGYKPSVSGITKIRISANIEWTLKLYEMIGDSMLREIDTDIYNIASNVVSHISTGEYVDSNATKCPQKFSALDTTKKYAIGVTVGKSGVYTVKMGKSAQEANMIDTVCENVYFSENIEKIIFGYSPSGNYERARISNEIDWEIKIYEIVDSKTIEENVRKLSEDVTTVGKEIISLKNTISNFNLIETALSSRSVLNYCKIRPLNSFKVYALGITVSATGTYSLQAGLYGSIAHMVETICEDTTFIENEEKIIYGYKPTGNYSNLRLSEAISWELKVYEIVNPVDIREVMANKYDNELISRNQYLRQYHHYTGADEIFYGVEWIENKAGVTRINTDGYDSLHETLPIQSKMRRCIVKDGILKYYLNTENSTLKEDGTAAKLDGTDGDVCVEIPEFFYKFEESINGDGDRVIKLKISEQGINGYNYSPKMYVGAYEATINRDTNILASVCTTEFTTNAEEVKIVSSSDYTASEDGYSLGEKTVVSKAGYTDNATIYRGGNNDASFDSVVDPTDNDYWRNQLGLPVARLSRDGYRRSEKIEAGKLMYLYDAHKALWILSTVEFEYKNIQLEIGAGGLGRGATVYYAYDAFKQWQKNYTEAIIPCGVTNSLGNNSGEVFVKLTNVPLSIEGVYPSADLATIERGDIWIPCMSYRGVEHYYGHLYKTLDQITLSIEKTGEKSDEDGKSISNVSYYYQKNPFLTDDLMLESELIGTYKFCANIRNTVNYIFGMDGHILPYDTSGSKSYDDESTYCDCTEFATASLSNVQVDVNGSIISGRLPGRNFLVACFSGDDDTNARVSNGTRITYVCTR